MLRPYFDVLLSTPKPNLNSLLVWLINHDIKYCSIIVTREKHYSMVQLISLNEQANCCKV